jgi:hypothetical protein
MTRLNRSRARLARLGSSLLVLWLGAPPSAQANERMTCAQAMTLVQNHPGIEASSILSVIANQWQAMDRRTAAEGHAAIAAQMLNSPAAINALSAQCNANPGQPLGAAAAQIYRQAREQLDGF